MVRLAAAVVFGVATCVVGAVGVLRLSAVADVQVACPSPARLPHALPNGVTPPTTGYRQW